MTPGLWALIVASAVLVFWTVGAYNRLVRLKNAIGAAFAQLDEQLRRRHELVGRLSETVQTALQHESAALEALQGAVLQAREAAERARGAPLQAGPLGALAGGEQTLAGSLQRVLALVAHHPEMQQDGAVSEIAQALDETRHRIGFARLAYNDQVDAFNAATAQFPTVVLARVFGFFPLEPLVALP
ncbi:LemA family protein [Hydrogenophaga sp. OTU3427]|uniref:LemA family protein n=1 Tax=Hydrogenophaga sp. OTU3427 TaxID=3043856 RepID=UPI00313B1235